MSDDLMKPKKRGRGRPTIRPDGRPMTRAEYDKAYRERCRQKLKLLEALMKQLPAMSS